MSEVILKTVADYYSEKLAEHGKSSEGVDWNSVESQELRFAQLAKVFEIDPAPEKSVNDYGCGFGSLCGWLRKVGIEATYEGCDISESMIEASIEEHGDHFTVGTTCSQPSDYGVASGIFNVMLDSSREEWEDYIFSTIETIASQSKRGFAFNCLTSYSDREYMRDDLYYGDPCRFFDFCKKKYSRNVALLHDYELYEFTILVRKGE